MNPLIHVRFFLFADVRNFSHIPDSAMPHFVERFLGGVDLLVRECGPGFEPPLFANTWGDGMLFVFRKAADAGAAALEIRDWLKKEPLWFETMPGPLGVRMAIHAGPVHESLDPVSGRTIFLGSHINRAARIEPITEEGQIFVSREFAALAEMEEKVPFRCVPQGLADLPKGTGRIPVYRLERPPSANGEEATKPL